MKIDHALRFSLLALVVSLGSAPSAPAQPIATYPPLEETLSAEPAKPKGLLSARENIILARVLRKIKVFVRGNLAYGAAGKAALEYIAAENLKPGSRSRITAAVSEYLSFTFSTCGDLAGKAPSNAGKRLPAQSGGKHLDCIAVKLQAAADTVEGEDPTLNGDDHDAE